MKPKGKKINCDLENGSYVYIFFVFVLFLIKQIKECRSVNYKVTNWLCYTTGVYFSDNKDKHVGDSKHAG